VRVGAGVVAVGSVTALLLFGLHVWPFIVAGALVGLIIYALWNPPRPYRRHGLDHVQQAVDHSVGKFSGSPVFELLTEGRPPKEVGRNDPCPCGSDRKYKRCCGSVTAS
jgi:hypothetical protein